MENPKFKQFNVLLREDLIAKLKAYGAFSNVSLRTFVERILTDKVRKIEKGEDKTIKIEKKEKSGSRSIVGLRKNYDI